MAQEILTPRQQKALDLFAASPLADIFYLTGGTALAAFYLRHRLSDDLDFFTDKEVNYLPVEHFIAQLKDALGARDVTYNRLHDRRIFYLDFPGEILKIEFSRYPYPRLGKLMQRGRLKIDDLVDIATNKLMALYDRFEPKDYIDLYFLLKKFKLKNLAQNVERKFGLRLEPIALGSVLAAADRLVQKNTPMPRLFKKVAVDDIRQFFIDLATDLGRTIIR